MRQSGSRKLSYRLRSKESLKKDYGMVFLHKSKINGPHFFSEPTVNGESYKLMLWYYAKPKILDFSTVVRLVPCLPFCKKGVELTENEK